MNVFNPSVKFPCISLYLFAKTTQAISAGSGSVPSQKEQKVLSLESLGQITLKFEALSDTSWLLMDWWTEGRLRAGLVDRMTFVDRTGR